MKLGPAPRPTWAFMFKNPAHLIALGFGSGLAPKAPGTVGTLWAWLSFWALAPCLSAVGWVILLVLGFGLGCWVCTLTAQHMETSDPGCIVWDEILAFWAVLWLITPAGFWVQLWAFLLFRFFDAAKPGPVAWADALFKAQPGQPITLAQGFGILFDDLVAALCTLMMLALWRWVGG